MKKLSLIAAIVFGLCHVSSASADLQLLTSNHQFNFDTDGTGTGFVLGTSGTPVSSTIAPNVNALSDLAVWVGYRPSVSANRELFKLQNPTVVSGNGTSAGQLQFQRVFTQPVNGSSVFDHIDVTMDLALAESGQQGELRYDLELGGTANGFLEAFVGFDYAGNNADVSGTSIPNTLGFGAGAADRVITAAVSGNNSLYHYGGPEADGVDVYDATTGNPSVGTALDDRFNNSFENFTPGTDLAFGSFYSLGRQNLATAAISDLQRSGAVGITTAAISATIPEPSSLMMAAIGFGIVGLRRKRLS
jgi:hypothetical protein